MAGEAATVSDNPYGIEALWTTSDYVGKGVFVILIVMSLWSWLVMINKWLDQRMLRKVANEAQKGFCSAGLFQEGDGKLMGKVLGQWITNWGRSSGKSFSTRFPRPF